MYFFCELCTRKCLALRFWEVGGGVKMEIFLLPEGYLAHGDKLLADPLIPT